MSSRFPAADASPCILEGVQPLLAELRAEIRAQDATEVHPGFPDNLLVRTIAALPGVVDRSLHKVLAEHARHAGDPA